MTFMIIFKEQNVIFCDKARTFPECYKTNLNQIIKNLESLLYKTIEAFFNMTFVRMNLVC